MSMIWSLGHASPIVIIVGVILLAAVASYWLALHAASYVEVAPVRVRSGRKGLS